MASVWHSQLAGKLVLAQALLRLAATDSAQPLQHEACKQGAVELLLRARQILLQTLAQCYQQRKSQPRTLAELTQLIGNDAAEVHQLQQLQANASSWWRHLEQLDNSQGQPPAAKKTVTDDNIIAVAPAANVDRSLASVQATLTALKQFSAHVEARHSEW